MIDFGILKPGVDYVFPCYTYDDYVLLLDAAWARGFYDSLKPHRRAHSLYDYYHDKGAIRIKITPAKTIDVGWADLKYYKRGGWGPCQIMEIASICVPDDLGEFDSFESDIASLICVGGTVK